MSALDFENVSSQMKGSQVTNFSSFKVARTHLGHIGSILLKSYQGSHSSLHIGF